MKFLHEEIHFIYDGIASSPQYISEIRREREVYVVNPRNK